MMISALFSPLHIGHGVEIPLLEYLARVLLHLLAFGAIALLVYWWLEGIEPIYSAFVAKLTGEAKRNMSTDEYRE